MKPHFLRHSLWLTVALTMLLTSCKAIDQPLQRDANSTSPSQTSSATTGVSPVKESNPSMAEASSAEEETKDAYTACGNYLEPKRAEYLAYQKLHPELPTGTVITYVNIGLNRPFYTEPTEITAPDDLLVLCNKYHYLPKDYVPKDLKTISSTYAVSGRTVSLRADAATAFEALSAAAKKDGFTILGQSGYRSYSYQETLYNNYVASDGQKNADTYSARPGYSEHQTGLAIDVRNASKSYTNFGSTAEFQWAKENISKFGFILHYLPEKQEITGYKTEEWHFRYVGKETAAKIQELGITFDEYCATYLTGQTKLVTAPIVSSEK